MNINDILANFNSDRLSQINEFLNSAQGKQAVSGLTDADKSRILEQFKRLDARSVSKALNGLSKEDILKMAEKSK